jgi:hypothetical protein
MRIYRTSSEDVSRASPQAGIALVAMLVAWYGRNVFCSNVFHFHREINDIIVAAGPRQDECNNYN